jgi:radical SAM protein with 4Fe4S-binding SPASM domain
MLSDINNVDGCDEFEQEVDLDATFIFPTILTEHFVLGKHLIIAPEHANWLVCDDDEYKAFKLFCEGKSIKEVSLLLQMDPERAMEVVSSFVGQIIGKDFLLDAKVVDRPLFKMASLSLTAGCNLRCSTCFQNATVVLKDECNLLQWQNFLRAYKDYGGEIVTITGGEPLLYADCLKVVEYAKNIGLKVVFLTNGTLLTKEDAKILCANCDQIRISIDGPNAESHDLIRGKGNFERAINGLRYLSEYSGYQLGIAMTPTPATIHYFREELGSFAKFVYEKLRGDIGIFVSGRLLPGRNTPKMSNEEKLAFSQEVHKICNDQLGEGYVERMNAINIIPNRRNFSCGMAANIMVSANGGIYICNYSAETVENIKDIQKGDEGQFIAHVIDKLGRIAVQTGVDKFYPCASCDLKYFCGGKCRLEYTNNTCQCDQEFRDGWYESLVCVNPYLFESLAGLEKGGEIT